MYSPNMVLKVIVAKLLGPRKHVKKTSAQN